MMKLWQDEAGSVVAAELIIIMTVVGLGMLVGMKVLQASIVGELVDVANAIGSIDQSFETLDGSSYVDTSNDPYTSSHVVGGGEIPK